MQIASWWASRHSERPAASGHDDCRWAAAGGRFTSAFASGRPQPLPFQDLVTFISSASSTSGIPFARDPMRFMVRCGIVYLAGISQMAGGGYFAQSTFVFGPTGGLSNGLQCVGAAYYMGFTASGGEYGTASGATVQLALRGDGFMTFGSNSAWSGGTFNLVSLYGISFPHSPC